MLLLTVLGGLAGYAYNSFLQTPLYKSDATLLIIDEEGKATKDSTLINNYIELIKSRRVLEPVLEKHRNTMKYEGLEAATTATNEKDTEVIKISVATEDARISKDFANDIVSSFQNEVGELYDKDNITVVDKANLPSTPYNVHQALYLSLATAGGLFAAVILLFFAYDFKQTRRAIRRESANMPASTAAMEPEEKTKKTTDERSDESQLFLPMPPAPKIENLSVPLTTPKTSRPKSRQPNEKRSLARRAMRTLAGLTLDIPERPAKKDEASKETA